MRYGVIDIGSNSVKFLVVEKSGATTRVVTEQSHSTRLAEDLIATAELKPEAMARTLALFTRLRAEGDQLGVDKWMAVATSAVRDARNRKEFLKAAADHLKFPVRLFSGEEEAETVFLGVTADHRLGQGDILVLDVGGGSSEWVQGKGGAIEKRVSLPLGCVRLRERFIDGYPVSPEKLAGMLQALQDQLQPVLAAFQLGSRHLIGTGGTITAAAALVLQLKKYDPEKVHLFVISQTTLEDKFRALAALPLEQLVKVTGMPENRADIIVPGIAVFLVTMRLLGAREVRVSTRGLRYGILERLMQG